MAWPIYDVSDGRLPRDWFFNIYRHEHRLRIAWLHSWRVRGWRWRLLISVSIDRTLEARQQGVGDPSLSWMFAPRIVGCKVWILTYERRRFEPGDGPLFSPVVRIPMVDYAEVSW